VFHTSIRTSALSGSMDACTHLDRVGCAYYDVGYEYLLYDQRRIGTVTAPVRTKLLRVVSTLTNYATVIVPRAVDQMIIPKTDRRKTDAFEQKQGMKNISVPSE
jgi:hypothetical protein